MHEKVSVSPNLSLGRVLSFKGLAAAHGINTNILPCLSHGLWPNFSTIVSSSLRSRLANQSIARSLYAHGLKTYLYLGTRAEKSFDWTDLAPL